MTAAYYNEHDPYPAQWIRNLIKAGLIPDGEVDERDIRSVQPDDVAGFDQCHWFAGIAGFAFAARLAGWPDDKPLWTGGFPCQPFSVAGRQLAQSDDRHLWPELHRLVAQVRPAWFLGENVAGIVGLALDGVCASLEADGFACRAFVIPACAVDAPHRRDRVWIIARNLADAAGRDAEFAPGPGAGPGEAQGGRSCGDVAGRGDAVRAGSGGAVADSGGERCAGRQDPASGHDADGAAAGRSESADRAELRREDGGGFWSDAAWITGRDGKARRVPQFGVRRVVDGISPGMAGVRSGIPLLAQGAPDRVAKLRALGNAIVPQVAAEVLKAMLEQRP